MQGELELVLRALEESGARYLIVGGVAVVLHGHPRFTADLDVVIQLDADNVRAAFAALARLDYRPRAPVAPEDFADPTIRDAWIRDKGLTVFSLWSPQCPLTEVDIFVQEPFDFDAVYSRALRADLGFATVSVIGLTDLLALKQAAGRAKDLDDIRALRQLSDDDE